MEAIESTTSRVSFGEFFTRNGKSISSLTDFWGWKADLIIDDLEEMLDELQDMIQTIRKTGTANQADLAEGASDELKRFASANGVDLATASLEDLTKLEQMLRDKIVELLKHSLALSSTEDSQSQDSVADADAETNPQETSLAETDFARNALQDVIDSMITAENNSGLTPYADLASTSSDNILKLCA